MLDRAAPSHVVAGRPGVGLTSPVPWRARVPAGDGLHRLPLEHPVVGQAVPAGAELTWAVLPQGLPDGVADAADLPHLEDLWAGTAVAVDLVLADGRRLSELGTLDQYGAGAGAGAQALARRTWVDQWNLRRVGLDAAAGQTIAAVELVVRANPRRELVIHLDSVDVRPVPVLPREALDRVRTTRGTNSTGEFSRGNTAPLVGVPHGCLYALPMTDAGSRRWVYTWHAGRPGDPRPTLQAVATSHLPSPWIGDRGVFQVMPTTGRSHDRAERALAFDHATETDRPHLWSARLAGGIEVEATAGPSVMAVRSTFPAGSDAGIVLDHLGTMRDVTITAEAAVVVVTGLLVDDVDEMRAGAPPHHVHVRVPAASGHDLSVTDGHLRGRVSVAAEAPVTVLVGLSTLDAGTAAAHVARVTSFDALADEAAAAWREILGTVEFEGATDDQQVALASGLYRLGLFPTRQDEPTGAGLTRWRSTYGERMTPSLRAAEIGDRPETGSGWYSATNGFWDTYRTAWPLLGLLTPTTAGLAAQGFVAHHLDSGWMPRWSAPSPADCMTGTTSDTVLADMIGYGVPGIDLRQAWASALTNASVPPSDPRVGRKGLHPGLFRGFVSTAVEEGMSWTLDAALNDWSAARIGRALAASLAPGRERAQVEAECEWLERRSLLYREVFDPDRGLFVGRDDNGGWRVPAAGFDPDEWGHDYTETNAWGTAVTVPHDGAGLAALHGGEDRLGALLDAILARPETGSVRKAGTYGGVIHEMTEARDCRMGMLALSNQPAHHIPFMYMHAGRHDDAHAVIADALDRLFVGSDLGQGFPGDEDNGEMSAWWILATIGLYPLVPASGTWVLTPPRVARTVLRPAGGAQVEIVVTNPDEGGRFIRSVTIDGEAWHEISVRHAVLARGARIEFELAEEPCGWAGSSRPFSASAVHGFADPLRDVTDGARSTHPGLVDDLAAGPVPLEASTAVEIELTEPALLGDLMTVTLAGTGDLGWTLSALGPDGWHDLDVRDGESFTRTGQTRVFRTAGTAAAVTRLRFVPDRSTSLLQLEAFAR
ncbi:GH92 family glycosyl hydrolase [Occultella kanbiaonis]|uniref:GH92 family glycosyl hydrolase n=1 Tax=Occultella kanbiaonis TaxID=2675754 RepID=UPI0013D24BAF|nr:GH92 family glycosyl hydrolase [Occultella kanbiaonis]